MHPAYSGRRYFQSEKATKRDLERDRKQEEGGYVHMQKYQGPRVDHQAGKEAKFCASPRPETVKHEAGKEGWKGGARVLFGICYTGTPPVH
eukprot:354622-Chlamydomonas_euryale.AAC.1